jgi:RimJ/RimL family protein N-acetyltransferase
MKPIRCERFDLVPVTPENAVVLWEILQQPDLREFQDLPELDAAQFRRAVAHRPQELKPQVWGRFEWLIYAHAGENDGPARPLGWVSLRVSERTPSVAEIGYSVVRTHRGRGIATQAVAALAQEAFAVAGVRCLRAYCLPDNAASRAVLRRNGFRDDGVLRHGAVVAGRTVDVVAHSLRRDGKARGIKAEKT